MDGPLSILVLTFIKLTTVPDETIPLNIGWHYYEDKYIFYADALRYPIVSKVPQFCFSALQAVGNWQLGKDDTQTQTFNKTQTVIVSNICDTQPAYTHIVPQKRRPAGNFLVSSLSSFFFANI